MYFIISRAFQLMYRIHHIKLRYRWALTIALIAMVLLSAFAYNVIIAKPHVHVDAIAVGYDIIDQKIFIWVKKSPNKENKDKVLWEEINLVIRCKNKEGALGGSAGWMLGAVKLESHISIQSMQSFCGELNSATIDCDYQIWDKAPDDGTRKMFESGTKSIIKGEELSSRS